MARGKDFKQIVQVENPRMQGFDPKAGIVSLTKELNLKLLNSIYPYQTLIQDIRKLGDTAKSETVRQGCKVAILQEFGKVREIELKTPSQEEISSQLSDEELDELLKEAGSDITIDKTLA